MSLVKKKPARMFQKDQKFFELKDPDQDQDHNQDWILLNQQDQNQYKFESIKLKPIKS